MSLLPVITIHANTEDANAPMQCQTHPSLTLLD